MMTEFASIQLTRDELKEVHAAMIQRALLEDELRRERGEEPLERRPLLEKLEALLGDLPQELEDIDHALEDELWEYAWYVYTDEWAHFRAHQEADRDGATGDDARAHQLYRKKFEDYVAEISMTEEKPKRSTRSREERQGSSGSSA